MPGKVRGICTPERFAALLRIFDGAWAEVEASGNRTAQETEAARGELAALVMAQMETDLSDTDKIRNEVLQAYWTMRSRS
jgi:hypothetical protein